MPTPALVLRIWCKNAPPCQTLAIQLSRRRISLALRPLPHEKSLETRLEKEWAPPNLNPRIPALCWVGVAVFIRPHHRNNHTLYRTSQVGGATSTGTLPHDYKAMVAVGILNVSNGAWNWFICECGLNWVIAEKRFLIIIVSIQCSSTLSSNSVEPKKSLSTLLIVRMIIPHV